MASYVVDSTKVGTVASGTITSGTITGIAVTMPPPQADRVTPLTLVDASAANFNANSSSQLYSAPLSALDFIYGIKPTIPVTPGLTPPAAGILGGAGMKIIFNNGLYVKSCPVGVTFTVTA